MGYNVDYNKNGLLCVTLIDYSYRGGAHGGTTKLSLIFDLATGNRLYLEDLMKAGSGYRSLINGAVRAEIDKRVQTGDLVELTAFEDIGDRPDFYLSEDGWSFISEYALFLTRPGFRNSSSVPELPACSATNTRCKAWILSENVLSAIGEDVFS